MVSQIITFMDKILLHLWLVIYYIYGRLLLHLWLVLHLRVIHEHVLNARVLKYDWTMKVKNSTQALLSGILCLTSSWPFLTCGCRAVSISEFTQQDGRKKTTAKRLSVTNVTGLLLARFVGSSLNIDFFLLFYKTICLKECQVCRKVFSNKIIVTLVAQGVPSSFLLRPFA